MVAPLPKFELILYSSVWLVSFVYSFYKVFRGGQLLQLTFFQQHDFSPPLHPSLGYRDSSDYDWELWTDLLVKLSPWVMMHLIVCETIRKVDPSLIPMCHTFITLGALVVNFPPETTFILIVTLIFFIFALLVRSKFITWFLAIGLLLSVNVFLKYFFTTYQPNYDEVTLTVLCFEWFLLKCIDFTLFEIHTVGKFESKFMNLLAYTFYLPCFFLGPFVPYEDFKKGLARNYEPLTLSRIKLFCFNLLRALFWYWFFQIAAHFFYCHAMHYKVDHVVSLGLWTLVGVGTCMAQFFFIKYIVVYGGALTIARFELYDVPRNPKCVNRIHLYSKMWRHFDQGFYLFLMRCIYKPVCGNRLPSIWRKLVASFYCFCFVFLWHGINRTMLIWSTLNFFGICLESFGKIIIQSPLINGLGKIIGNTNMRRLEALVCSPLWVMAVISNYIFFGDYDLGMAYVYQLFSVNWAVLLFVFTFGYCMCQLSIEVGRRQSIKSLCK